MKSKQLKAPIKSLPAIWNYTSLAIVAAAVMVGIALGVGLSSSVSFSPENVASSQSIDLAAPDPQVCVQYGASAMALDARLFVTLKPFSVYISQPKMQPGCVIRRNDWAILEQKKLVSATQEQECKNSMNTFGFTGTLEESPKIDCVYQNNAAGNFFLKQAGISQQAR